MISVESCGYMPSGLNGSSVAAGVIYFERYATGNGGEREKSSKANSYSFD